MNQQQVQQQTFDKIALFSVAALSVISLLFYEFTSKPELYNGDQCQTLRTCAIVIYWEYLAFVIIIAAMLQWKAPEESRIKLYVTGIMLIGFIISNVWLEVSYLKNEHCGLLRVTVFWYLLIVSIAFVLFSGIIGTILYMMK